MTKALVVVISGQVAAGKTTAAKMLEKRGFQYARIAKAIKKLRWPSDRADKPPRSWYQQIGQELHETIGQKALCGETMTFVARPDEGFVVDGARWKEDVAYFRDRFGERVIHLHLLAPTDVRKRRFEAREKDVSFEEADGGEVESEVPLLAPMADKSFQNDSDDAEKLSRFLDLALKGAGSAG